LAAIANRSVVAEKSGTSSAWGEPLASLAIHFRSNWWPTSLANRPYSPFRIGENHEDWPPPDPMMDGLHITQPA
jgi:hypothetical protein